MWAVKSFIGRSQLAAFLKKTIFRGPNTPLKIQSDMGASTARKKKKPTSKELLIAFCCN